MIKKILKHLDLWEIKRKPRPVANAPRGDLFPEHDEQPGPCIDDPPSFWILRRDKLPDRPGLPRRSLFLWNRAVAGSEGGKTTFVQNRTPTAKIQDFQPQFRFDAKAVTWYWIPVGGFIMKMAGVFPDPLHIAIRQIIEHNR